MTHMTDFSLAYMAEDFANVKQAYGGVFPSLERRGLIAGRGVKSSLVVVQSRGEPQATQQQEEKLRHLSLIHGYFHKDDGEDGNVYNFLGVPALGSNAAKARAVQRMADVMLAKFDEVTQAVHTDANSGDSATVINPRAVLFWVMRFTLPASLMYVARNCNPEITRNVFEAFDTAVFERFVDNSRLSETAWLKAYRSREGERAAPASLRMQFNLSLRQAGFAVTSLANTCDAAFIGASAKSMLLSQDILEASAPPDTEGQWLASMHNGPYARAIGRVRHELESDDHAMHYLDTYLTPVGDARGGTMGDTNAQSTLTKYLHRKRFDELKEHLPNLPAGITDGRTERLGDVLYHHRFRNGDDPVPDDQKPWYQVASQLYSMGQGGGISTGVFNCYPKPDVVTDEVFCYATLHASLGVGWYDDEKETCVCTFCFQRIHTFDKAHVLYCRGSSLTSTLSARSVAAARRYLCTEFPDTFLIDKGGPLVKPGAPDSPARFADLGILFTRDHTRFDVDFTWINNEGSDIAGKHHPAQIFAPAVKGEMDKARRYEANGVEKVVHFVAISTNGVAGDGTRNLLSELGHRASRAAPYHKKFLREELITGIKTAIGCARQTFLYHLWTACTQCAAPWIADGRDGSRDKPYVITYPTGLGRWVPLPMRHPFAPVTLTAAQKELKRDNPRHYEFTAEEAAQAAAEIRGIQTMSGIAEAIRTAGARNPYLIRAMAREIQAIVRDTINRLARSHAAGEQVQLYDAGAEPHPSRPAAPRRRLPGAEDRRRASAVLGAAAQATRAAVAARTPPRDARVDRARAATAAAAATVGTSAFHRWRGRVNVTRLCEILAQAGIQITQVVDEHRLRALAIDVLPMVGRYNWDAEQFQETQSDEADSDGDEGDDTESDDSYDDSKRRGASRRRKRRTASTTLQSRVRQLFEAHTHGEAAPNNTGRRIAVGIPVLRRVVGGEYQPELRTLITEGRRRLARLGVILDTTQARPQTVTHAIRWLLTPVEDNAQTGGANTSRGQAERSSPEGDGPDDAGASAANTDTGQAERGNPEGDRPPTFPPGTRFQIRGDFRCRRRRGRTGWLPSGEPYWVPTKGCYEYGARLESTRSTIQEPVREVAARTERVKFRAPLLGSVSIIERGTTATEDGTAEETEEQQTEPIAPETTSGIQGGLETEEGDADEDSHGDGPASKRGRR